MSHKNNQSTISFQNPFSHRYKQKIICPKAGHSLCPAMFQLSVFAIIDILVQKQ